MRPVGALCEPAGPGALRLTGYVADGAGAGRRAVAEGPAGDPEGLGRRAAAG
jgi:hypothetical protein